jgi:hypothetical protein
MVSINVKIVVRWRLLKVNCQELDVIPITNSLILKYLCIQQQSVQAKMVSRNTVRVVLAVTMILGFLIGLSLAAGDSIVSL